MLQLTRLSTRLFVAVMLSFSALGQAAPLVRDSPADLQIVSFSATKKYRQHLPAPISNPRDEVQAEPPAKKQPYWEYRAVVKNTGAKVITAIGWQYLFRFDDRAGRGEASKDYTNRVTIKPGGARSLRGEGGPDVPGFTVEEGGIKRIVLPASERVLIMRVEYADGSVWQAQPMTPAAP